MIGSNLVIDFFNALDTIPLLQLLRTCTTKDFFDYIAISLADIVIFDGLLSKTATLPHGWHTLDIECKGVLSIGI